MTTAQRIIELVHKISIGQETYYNDIPIMPDSEYDALYDELKQIDPNNPVLKTVGAKVPEDTKLQKMKHKIPMGSQAKVSSEEDFRKWVKKTGATSFVCQEKLDGISIELVYENGLLTKAITRGDGFEGESVLHTVSLMENVRDKFSNFSGSLRGEIILQKTRFEKYFKDDGYSNPRNTASGFTRKKTVDERLKHLKVIYFDVLTDNEIFHSESDKMNRIATLGLDRVETYFVGVENAVKWYNYYVEKLRDTLDYEIDGLIFKINDLEEQEMLGSQDNRPKGQIAWKFPNQEKKSTVEKITWQVGGTGRVTPVCHITPVELGGVTVTKASLYNYGYIERLEIGVGAKVVVSRAGDVIPRIERVLEKTKTEKCPNKCPDCHASLTQEGEYLLCTNKACPNVIKGSFEKWIKVLKIEECGPAFLDDIIENGLVYDIAGLYELKIEDLQKLDGYQKKKATNIVKQINKNKEVSLPVFLGGLGIEGASVSTFELIQAAGYDTLEKITAIYETGLENIDGIGEITAHNILNGLDIKANVIKRLLDYVTIKDQVEGKLSGKSFCFTGALEIKRGAAKKLVEDLGGTVKSSVSKGLTYLVQANPTSTSGKTKKALKYGTKVIGEDDFMDIVDYDIDKIMKMEGEV